MDLLLKKENIPIQAGDGLIEINNFNIIIGENGVGKTRYIEQLIKEYNKQYNFVYIKASSVIADQEFKSSNKTSNLINSLANLFNNLDITPELKNKTKIKNVLYKFFEHTNKNLEELSYEKKYRLENNITENLEISLILQSMLDKFIIKEKHIKDRYEIKDLGQGYQRMFIASLLKTYIDLGVEYGFKNSDKEIILIVEEPELFLHPKLKISLNTSLFKIAQNNDNNTRVIISTHDPYFIYTNENEKNNGVKFYLFEKNKKYSKITPDPNNYGDIVDYMTHIILFNKMFELYKNKYESQFNTLSAHLGNDMYKFSNLLKHQITEEEFAETIEYIKPKKQGRPSKFNVLLPIYVRNTIHHKDEVIDSDILKKSIKTTLHLIGNMEK